MLANSTVGVTHGLQLIFAKIEFLILLFLQFNLSYTKKYQNCNSKANFSTKSYSQKLITKRIYNRKYYNQ